MNLSDTDILRRLKMQHRDHDTTNFNILDFVGAFGSVLEAIMYSRLFWPEFVEINGMVFLRETIENDEDRSRLEKSIKESGANRCQTEKSFNLFEIPSTIFGHGIGESTDEEDRHLAEIITAMWSARLKLKFPDRQFKVQIVEPEETGGEIAVIFFQSAD